MSTAELERLNSPGLRSGTTELAVRPLRRRSPPRAILPGARTAADSVASLYPAARPCDDVVAALTHRSAPAFDARASATSWIVAEGLTSCDYADSDRIVEGWRAVSSDCSVPLVTDGGCDVCIGCSRVGGALRVALLKWLPLTQTDLAVYDGGLFRGDPAKAVTLLVRPPTIWSLDEALLAESLYPRGNGFEPERFAALERHARPCVGPNHLSRLRDAVARIERQLPFEVLPAASAIVASGCALVAADDELCAATAARQLARFATSALVAGESATPARRSR